LVRASIWHASIVSTMVRRDANEAGASQEVTSSDARCASPAGASPAPVGREAPGSRSQALGETRASRAGRRKPAVRREPSVGEQARGPQHEVKPAASTEEQSGSRAAHVTAKATSDAGPTGRAEDPGGVRGAARVQVEARNTGDPSAQPRSRQGGSYKPEAKSSAVQRESEGLVVPSMVATNNAIGGKGPCFGHARSEGKCEGMAARSGPNDPVARSCDVQVRRPQCELWTGAERLRRPWSYPVNRARGDARARRDGSGRFATAHAPSGRPSVSRVPEIGMHGLKGGPTGTAAPGRKGR